MREPAIPYAHVTMKCADGRMSFAVDDAQAFRNDALMTSAFLALRDAFLELHARQEQGLE